MQVHNYLRGVFLCPENEAKMERMLTRPELVEALQISGATIYRLVKIGKFPPPVRIGITAVRWHPADIQKWLESRKQINQIDGNS